MSLQFNNPTNLNGIIQSIERNCKLEGKISSNTTLLKNFTSDINISFDEILFDIFDVGGKWQFDDSNHTDYPIITTNLVAGQRDYSFTTDEQGNIILDIYKVLVKNTTTGKYDEIYPVDVQSEYNTQSFTDGNNTQGTVYRYDKTGNGIFLDQIPSENITNGLKIYINREASYFVYTDTTKKPGIAGHLHEWFSLSPSYKYAMRNGLSNREELRRDMEQMRNRIKKHYSRRGNDDKRVFRTRYRSAE